MNESFKDFIYRTLASSMPEPMVQRLVLDQSLETYFRRAFTHITFIEDSASAVGKFNYDVMGKLGDKSLVASFQLYLFSIIGEEVFVEAPYADMEKNFLTVEQIVRFTELLGFDRWINVSNKNKITSSIKKDIFTSFIGAIILAADAFIMKDMGMPLAKQWVFQVLETHARDKFDPKDMTKYVDYRSRVNNIWLFNGWGKAVYRSTGDSRSAREAGVVGFAAANLLGPNLETFPARLRGKNIGTGTGRDLAKAKEEAARTALETLKVNFSDLKGREVEFSLTNTDPLEAVLGNDHMLLRRTIDLMKKKENVYKYLVIRRLKIYDYYVVQLRYMTFKNNWENGSRARSPDSELKAIRRALEVFINKNS